MSATRREINGMPVCVVVEVIYVEGSATEQSAAEWIWLSHVSADDGRSFKLLDAGRSRHLPGLLMSAIKPPMPRGRELVAIEATRGPYRVVHHISAIDIESVRDVDMLFTMKARMIEAQLDRAYRIRGPVFALFLGDRGAANNNRPAYQGMTPSLDAAVRFILEDRTDEERTVIAFGHVLKYTFGFDEAIAGATNDTLRRIAQGRA